MFCTESMPNVYQYNTSSHIIFIDRFFFRSRLKHSHSPNIQISRYLQIKFVLVFVFFLVHFYSKNLSIYLPLPSWFLYFIKNLLILLSSFWFVLCSFISRLFQIQEDRKNRQEIPGSKLFFVYECVCMMDVHLWCNSQSFMIFFLFAFTFKRGCQGWSCC